MAKRSPAGPLEACVGWRTTTVWSRNAFLLPALAIRLYRRLSLPQRYVHAAAALAELEKFYTRGTAKAKSPHRANEAGFLACSVAPFGALRPLAVWRRAERGAKLQVFVSGTTVARGAVCRLRAISQQSCSATILNSVDSRLSGYEFGGTTRANARVVPAATRGR
jgi:hypothetical protein